MDQSNTAEWEMKFTGKELDMLEREARAVVALLADRQPGLMTWNMFLYERLATLRRILAVLTLSVVLGGCSLLGLYGGPAFPGPATPGLDGSTIVYTYGLSGQRMGTAVIGGPGVLLYTPGGARAGTGLRGR